MSHYFTDEKLGETHDIIVHACGKEFTFLSAQGLFSKDRLDTGTRLLIEESQVPSGARVLDLGCGIGVVGIVLKLHDDTITVVQSDVTEKAVALTNANRKKLHAQTTVVKSDVYEKIPEQFEVILTNPPRAAGKATIARMIAQAPAHLVSGGSLQLVALTNKGGETYKKLMEETFGNVDVIARGSGFKIYKSVLQ